MRQYAAPPPLTADGLSLLHAASICGQLHNSCLSVHRINLFGMLPHASCRSSRGLPHRGTSKASWLAAGGCAYGGSARTAAPRRCAQPAIGAALPAPCMLPVDGREASAGLAGAREARTGARIQWSNLQPLAGMLTALAVLSIAAAAHSSASHGGELWQGGPPGGNHGDDQHRRQGRHTLLSQHLEAESSVKAAQLRLAGQAERPTLRCGAKHWRWFAV